MVLIKNHQNILVKINLVKNISVKYIILKNIRIIIRINQKNIKIEILKKIKKIILLVYVYK